MKLKPGQHIHLVGIGGSGLSAIARILLGQGYRVSGSDRAANELTDALARDGTTIYKGHDPQQVEGADALIITSAVKDDHPEIVAARACGIPVYKRQDIMADLMVGKIVIAVAGTKGKTTTTSMIVHILRECGLDPSYIVGGIMGNTGTNAGVGKGDAFVVEADEYDNMFLGLRPDVIVLTNIEYDHPDFFKTPDEMVQAFRQFISLLEDKRGMLVACADDPTALKLAEEFRAADQLFVSTYGLSEYANHQALNVRSGRSNFTLFEVDIHRWGNSAQTVQLGLSGKHNIQNALAALLAVEFTFPNRCDVQALATFRPTARRFELRADINGIAIIDDYAHNPMSIRAVLEAAQQRYPERELWAVWQPHTYSRTQALFNDFTKAFGLADHVLITNIYAARESPIPGVTSASVVNAIKHPDVHLAPTFADAVAVLSGEVRAPAVVLIMSAGDAPQVGIDYLSYLQTKANAETL